MVKLEDLKQQYPDPPEFIHQMILDEVEKQMGGLRPNTYTQRASRNSYPCGTGGLRPNTYTEAAGTGKRRKHPWTFRQAAAAVLAACMSIGMVGFAAVSLYHLSMEENGRYGVVTEITTAADEDKSVPLPEKISDVRIQADYIPEGMHWDEEQYHLEYEDDQTKEGFSFNTLLLDTESNELNITDTNVVEKEKTDFGEHEGIYMRMEETGYSQKIYLLCPEVYRILVMYIGEDVTKEDAYKTASGIKLVETGEMLDTSEVWKWSEFIGQNTESGSERDGFSTSVPKNEIAVHEIGKAFPLEVSGNDTDGNAVSSYEDPEINVEVKVDSVEISDDLSLLEGDQIAEKCKSNIGPDGKLLKNQLSYIKRGDGIQTLDETIRTEEEVQKLVLVTASYTNQGSKEIHNVCYNGNILLIQETEDEYRIYSYDGEMNDVAGGGYDEISGQAYDAIEQTGFTGRDRIYGSLNVDYGMGGNYIPALRPGESVQIKMAWITNERDLGNMYLNLCDTGGLWEFDEYMIKTGIVDIRQ